MAANEQDLPERTPKDFRRLLKSWFDEHGFQSVTFGESSSPSNDKDEDYAVVYEATFTPADLKQAQVELWLTSEGLVAIGFETTARIAARLNLEGGSDRFAAGHEPCSVSDAGVIGLLEAVSAGRFSVRVRPALYGLGSMSAVMKSTDIDQLKETGYKSVGWVENITSDESPTFGSALPFRPWT